MRPVHLLPLALLLLPVGCASPPAPDPDETPASDDRHAMAAAYSADKAGDAIIIYEAGEVVLAEGQNGYPLDRPHILASGTKSFSGVLALAAQADGLLDIDALIAEVIPEWADDDEKASITVRQLLNLTSGLDPGQVGQAQSFDASLDADLVHEPGEEFRYGPDNFQAFGGVLNRVLEGEAADAYLERRILEPIGATVAEWNTTDGDTNLSAGARMTADDWLRFGQLVLNDGAWNGEQILEPGVRDALRETPSAAPGYGLTFWLNHPVPEHHAFLEYTPVQGDGPEGFIYTDGPDDLLMAAGLFNQRLYVIPSREMVVVRFGRADPSWNDAEFLARVLEGEPLDRPQAQEARTMVDGDELMARMRMTQLTNELDLSEAQQEELFPEIKAHMERMQDLLEPLQADESLRRLQRLRLLRQVRQQQDATDEVVLNVLTSEQAEQYNDLRERERSEFRERWQNGR